jgi:hypothetical protein
VKREVVEELLFDVADSQSLCEEVREFIEGLFQARGIERFAEAIVSAAFDGFDRRIDRIVAGDENDTRPRIIEKVVGKTI